jgi:hypothetical protein
MGWANRRPATAGSNIKEVLGSYNSMPAVYTWQVLSQRSRAESKQDMGVGRACIHDPTATTVHVVSNASKSCPSCSVAEAMMVSHCPQSPLITGRMLGKY